MARIPISLESKRRLHEADPRWISKATLRLISSFFAVLALILFAVAVGKTVQWENTWDDGYGNDWTDGMPLAPVLLALLYNPFSLFMLIRYRRGRAYHPGWDVGVDLIIWALAVPSIVFSVGDGWFWWWQPVMLEVGDFVPCDEFNFWSKACQPEIYTIGGIEIAANIFLALILVIHFSLFVMACIATHRWRKQAKLRKAERRNIELQYHRNPEAHAAQQPPGYSLDGKRASSVDSEPTPPAEAVVKYA